MFESVDEILNCDHSFGTVCLEISQKLKSEVLSIFLNLGIIGSSRKKAQTYFVIIGKISSAYLLVDSRTLSALVWG